MDTKPILGPPRPVDWLCLASLAALWGSSFAVIEIGLRGLTPTWLVAVRIGVAVCLLNLLRRSRGLALPPLRGGPWGRLAALAVFGNLLPFLLISWGQREVESGVAGVLMATTPLLTLGLAHRFVPGEGITARKTLGFPLALVGVALLLGVAPGNVDRVGGWHQGAVLLGAGCYAANTVLARRLPAMPLLTTASAVFLLAFAVALPVAGALDGFAVTTNSGVAFGAAIWLGVGPTALATLIHLRVVRSAGAAFASST